MLSRFRPKWPGGATRERTNWLSNMLQGVAAVVAIVTALSGLMWLLSQCTSPPRTGPEPGTTSPRNVPSGPPSMVGSAACWDGSSPPQPVSCGDAHRFQAFGTAQECGESQIRAFLGADPFDVIRFEIRAGLDPNACVIDGLEERDYDFNNVLLGESSAQWRECIAGVRDVAQTYRRVPCSLPHQAELLSTDLPEAPGLATCADLAGRYMNRTLESLSKELMIRRIAHAPGGEGSPQCAIWIVSGRPLDDTLRNLGNQNLPRG